MNKNKFLALAFIIVCVTMRAQKFNDFNYYRELSSTSTESYYKIKLDNELLGKSNYSYADFRLFRVEENDTIETPYLINWDKDRTEYIKKSEALIDISFQNNKKSYYTIKLRERREINELFLEINENNFDKIIKLEGSDDNSTWKTIKENLRIVGFESVGFKYSKISFPTSSYPYYRLSLNDEHTKRIQVMEAYTAYNQLVLLKQVAVKDIYIVRKEIKKTEKPQPKLVFVPENYTEIKINLPYKACIRSLNLSCRDKTIDYYRNIAIYDKKGKELYYGTFTSLNDNRNTYCELNDVVVNDLIIKIFNNDNEALPGIDIKVNGAEASLIAKLDPEEKYLLAYSGRKMMQEGVYDLNYFSTKIESNSSELKLLPEKIIKHEKPKKKTAIVSQEKWLWITLVGLVLLLGGFAYSLMKKVNR